MQLENVFEVPVPVDDAWRVLLDVELIAPCLPGATVDSVDGDEVVGRVKVKLGPIALTYRGMLTFLERDETAHRAVMQASAREAGGSGTANATITTDLVAVGNGTQVKVVTDLNVTGKPAQFGRGVMQDVSAHLVQQFASTLAQSLESGALVTGTPVASGAPASTAHAAPAGARLPGLAALPSPPRPSPDAIDLLGVASGALAGRLRPLLAGGAAAFLLGWLLGRRRSRSASRVVSRPAT